MDNYPQPDEAVWIYMSIQLYSIDRDFFVVDFKCAGYERLVSNLVREIKASPDVTDVSSSYRSKHKHEDGWDDEQGRMEGDKVCTSPFPFLDVASTLILQSCGEVGKWGR